MMLRIQTASASQQRRNTVAEGKKTKVPVVVATALVALALGGYLLLRCGNPQWHWRLYAYQAGGLEKKELEPGASYSGAWNNWDVDGRLLSTFQYRDGKRDGAYVVYNPEGGVLSEGKYRNGGLDGLQRINRGEGFRTEINYKDGKQDGVEKTFHPNGEVAIEAQWVDGLQDGPMTFYTDAGMIQATVPYYQGKREGIMRTFHDSGALQADETYRNDMLNGKSEFWREDGSPDMVLHYRDDMQDGMQTWFYPDGKKARELLMSLVVLDGQIVSVPNGEWKEWDEEGKLVVDEVYEMGELKKRDGKDVRPQSGR